MAFHYFREGWTFGGPAESALALASIGPRAGEAVPALVAAQRDSVPAVREAAGEAIRQITATRR